MNMTKKMGKSLFIPLDKQKNHLIYTKNKFNDSQRKQSIYGKQLHFNFDFDSMKFVQWIT